MTQDDPLGVELWMELGSFGGTTEQRNKQKRRPEWRVWCAFRCPLLVPFLMRAAWVLRGNGNEKFGAALVGAIGN